MEYKYNSSRLQLKTTLINPKRAWVRVRNSACVRAHQCIVLDMILKRCLQRVNTLKPVNQSHNQLLLFSGHWIIPSPHPHEHIKG